MTAYLYSLMDLKREQLDSYSDGSSNSDSTTYFQT